MISLFFKAARVGIPFGLAFWVFESFFHVYVLGDGTLEQQLFRPELHELWMRLLVLISLTAFAVYAASLFRAQSRIEEVSEEASELRKAQEALAVSEEQFRKVFEQSPVGIVIADTELKILDSNPALQQTFGFTAEEYRGLSVPELSHPDDMAQNQSLVDETLGGGSPGYELEKRLLSKAGAEMWGRVRASLVRDSAGNPQYFIGTIEDITQRRRATQLSEALNALNPSIMASLDSDSILMTAASQASRVLGSDSSAVTLLENDKWNYAFSEDVPIDTKGIGFSSSSMTHQRIMLGTSDLFAQQSIADEDRISDDPINAFGVGSLLSAPITKGDKVVGTIDFYYHSMKREAFSDMELDFARKLGISVSLALANADILAGERHIATNLQEALEPKLAPIADLELGHIYKSATEMARVGGDFYDAFDLDASRVALVIGDVSGKGVEAARFTGLLRHTIRAYSYEHTSPAEIMASCNLAILPIVPGSMFATVFMGIFDKKACKLTYCCAGHPPPIIVNQRGVQPLPLTQSPIVGAFKDMEFHEKEIELGMGSSLLMYTDGVTESKGSEGLLGQEGLELGLRNFLQTRTADLPAAVYELVENYATGDLGDDVAILAVSPQCDCAS